MTHVVGYMIGKSAILLARNFKGKQRSFTGEAFWARGYFVSIVDLDEEMVRAYIQNQEEQDCHRDQLEFDAPWALYFSPLRTSSNKPPALP